MSRYQPYLVALAGSAVLLASGSALACGALPPPRFGFASAQPELATALPVNASVVLHTTCSLPGESQLVVDAACAQPPIAGASVTLQPPASGRLSWRGETLIFVPDAALLSNTQYQLTAQLGVSTEESSPALLSTTFSTGDALLSPPVSREPARLIAEWYDAPIAMCGSVKLVGQASVRALAPQICPSYPEPCVSVAGSERIMRLRALFGPMSGGFSVLPYTAQLVAGSGGLAAYGGNVPAPVDTPTTMIGQPLGEQSGTASSGTMAELFLDIAEPSDPATSICARARIFDAAGQVIAAPARCDSYANWRGDADEEWPDAILGGADAGHELASPDLKPTTAKDDSGCSTGSRSAGSPSWALASLATLALLRRRRSRVR